MISRNTLSSNKVFSNLFYLYGSYFARYIFPLIVIPFLSRVLGPVAWGEILYAQNFALYIALVVEFGFGLSATRDIARFQNKPELLAGVTNNVLTIQFLLSLLVVVLSLICIETIDIFKSNPALFITALLMGISQGLNYFWFFRGLEKMKHIAIVEFSTKLLSTLLIFLFVRQPLDSILVLVFGLIANLLASSYNLWQVSKILKIKIAITSDSWNIIKTSSRFFWVRAGAGLSSLGLIFICGIYLSAELLAFFVGAEKIITTARSLLTPAIDALFPRLSNLIKNERTQGIHLAKKSFYAMILIGLSLSIGIYSFSNLIIQIMLGSGYEESITILKIMSPLPFIISINHSLGSQWMVPIGLDSIFSRTVIIIGLVNLIGGIVLLELGFHHYSIPILIVGSNLLLTIVYEIILRSRKLHFFQPGTEDRLTKLDLG